MWSNQIETVLTRDTKTQPVFGGVYASDQLPKDLLPGKRLYVANTDPASKPGQHWVAFYFDQNGGCSYFDSYGFPPTQESFLTFIQNNANHWTFNTERIQHPKSTVCGHYCIFFGVHMCRGLKMGKIVSMFDADPRLNDIMVVHFINHYYLSSADTTLNNSGQTCCCALESLPYMS